MTRRGCGTRARSSPHAPRITVTAANNDPAQRARARPLGGTILAPSAPTAGALWGGETPTGISATRDDLPNDGPAAPASPPAEEPNPIEMWESRYDEAVGSARLSRIRAALALSEDRQFLFSEILA